VRAVCTTQASNVSRLSSPTPASSPASSTAASPAKWLIFAGGTPASQSPLAPKSSSQAKKATCCFSRLTVARPAGRVNFGNVLCRVTGSTTSIPASRARALSSSRPATSR
jgi:hypothetical protein